MPEPRGVLRPLVKVFGLLLGAFLILSFFWWVGGRATATARRLELRSAPEIRTPEGGPARPTLTVLAWNIAHGRGNVTQGWTNNWKGGGPEERVGRLMAIARVIRESGADLVILNEVDFAAEWSQGLNQAESLARGTGYPTWVEQRNYDIQLPFWSLAFGNALLSRIPLEEVCWIDIPPHSTLEALALGAKGASVARIDTPLGPLAVVPVHLEYRARETRMAALPVFDSLQARESRPVILAGDFNTAPSGWPGTAPGTLLDSLLARGWTSPRALGKPEPEAFTFPTPGLLDARDWILVEPPLEVLEVRVIHEAGDLSDHAPVLAVIGLKAPPIGEEERSPEIPSS